MEEFKKDDLLENLNIHAKTKEILKNAGYKTIEDLAASKKEDVEKYFIGVKEEGFWGYDGSRAFEHLKAIIHHDFHVTFNGEYEELGLALELATIPTSSLKLPTAIKTVLTRQLMAYTFGDILTIDCERFLKARNFGEYNLKVLKDYVHSLGYTLKNEKHTLNEILASLKEKGVRLLEEDIDNPRIYMSMYRNGIYSIEDLLNYGPDVNKIAGFGPLRQQELAKKMKKLNLTFDINPQKNVEVNDITKPADNAKPNDAIVEQTKKENDAIKTRIHQKEILIAEYDHLIEERKQLIVKEQELDQLIQTKLNDMKEGISYVRKKH